MYLDQQNISNNITEQYTRIQELQKKINRTPQEEGELMGLYAHPDNPRASMLRQKEYLAGMRIGRITPDEKEELRKIRATIYAESWKNSDWVQIQSEEPTAVFQNQNGYMEEWNYLCAFAKLKSLEQWWNSKDPKDILDWIIANTEPPKVTTEIEAWQTKVEPSDFELFLISRLKKLSFNWSQENKNPGSLWVLESMICMRDTTRTKIFLQWIQESIWRLQSKNISPIRMCDAGCWSVPILAIYACLCSKDVKCTCLELNSDAIPIAQAIVDSFWLGSRITILQADAITYEWGDFFDFLISETMHSWLTEEPMVQIFKNLSTQVIEKWEMIPKRVNVNADLMTIQEFFWSGKVVKIYSDKNLHRYFDKILPTKFVLDTKNPESFIEFELEASEDWTYLIVLTSDLNIWDKINLNRYESLITMPQVIQSSDGNPRLINLKKWDKIRITYDAWSRQRNISITEIK